MNSQVKSPPPNTNTQHSATPTPTTPISGRITYVGVVNDSNRPVFFRRYNGSINKLKQHERKTYEIMYNALDVMMERADDDRDSGMESDDGFMGCLGIFGRESLYGSLTNGGYKVLVGVDNKTRQTSIKDSKKTEEKEKEEEEEEDVVNDVVTLRSALRRIEDAVVGAMLNPLQKKDQALRGKNVVQNINDIVNWYG